MKRRLTITHHELATGLRALRDKLKFTQWEMVIHKFKNQISLKTYSDWENGIRKPASQIQLSKLKEIGIL